MRPAVPAVLLTLAALAAPASAQAAGDACKESLSTAGSYGPFTTTAGKRLGFGQLTVNATTANPHRYCVRIKLGSRTVTYQRYSNTYAQAANGAWRKIGEATSPATTTRSFTQTLAVQKDRRKNVRYGLRVNGVWYYATVSRENP